jgi:hypothetical protein
MDIPIELQDKIKLDLYYDEKNGSPIIGLRIHNKAFDRTIWLSLDQAAILGRTIATQANKAMGLHILSRGSIGGPV